MDSSIIILSQEQRKELTTIPENIGAPDKPCGGLCRC